LDPREITRLLAAAREGDLAARDVLYSSVYDQLRQIARRILSHERSGHTLDTTAVVHEAYLRLSGGAGILANDREHFFAIAARAMRHLLVDHARRRQASKRDAKSTPSTITVADADDTRRLLDVIAVDRALERLAAVEERLARVVELRFFAGLSVEEAGEVLGVTSRTVKRDWSKARAILLRMLSENSP